MSKVRLKQTAGNVFIQSNGEKKKVEAKIPDELEDLDTLAELYGSNTVPIHDGDMIITEKDSYAINIQDENDPDYTALSLFPNSKARVSIRGKEITEVELMKGLFRVETKNPIQFPLAEIRYLDDATQILYIEVKDEEVSISLVASQVEVAHEKSDKKVRLQMKEQATLTPSDIEGPLEVDQKFKDAYKIQRKFEAKLFDLHEDASFLQQKAMIIEIERTIEDNKQDIKEIQEEGGNIPKQMIIGVEQLERQLAQAKKEYNEELERRRKAPEKEEELAEFEKKFAARQKKFQEELDAMAQEISSRETMSQSEGELTELEKRIQAAGKELKTNSSEGGGSEDDGLTELEKKIQAAGKELETNSSEGGGSEDDGLTELERKIRDA